ncbi:unnamed protein product [Lactuca saligna]|uniref:Uncharacterized protein n=1 Tax=Lactuca saligna TaxID=75948 RepID=A0AA35YVZ8_LACSI|nr:unnamed protein product [Lactuca saligna]
MAIRVLANFLILLYQERKLLPAGRRNGFYLGIMSKVSIFVVLGIILLGAGFGYWLVRKYIISEDGEVDVGVAVTCIILSMKDTHLAMTAVGSCLGVYYMITKIVRQMPCRIYTTLKELNLEFMKRNNFVSPKVTYGTATALQNVSFHLNGRFLNECNSFHFLEFMKRNNFVCPKVAYETATDL